VIIKRRLLPLLLKLALTTVFISGTAAKKFMITDFPYVTRRSSRSAVQALLTKSGWTVCAFLSDEESRFLLGVISRSAIEDSLRVGRNLSVKDYIRILFARTYENAFALLNAVSNPKVWRPCYFRSQILRRIRSEDRTCLCRPCTIAAPFQHSVLEGGYLFSDVGMAASPKQAKEFVPCKTAE